MVLLHLNNFGVLELKKKTSGTISVSDHFKAWTSKGMRLGLMYEDALTIEGYQSSGSATVNQNDITGG